ncbi:hypothetical protein B0H11DRAFT_1715205 [Mycena galericulata]|nr:hypothetical protein B0H11DRAFT_1715205 [Mycena galericulata]
MLLGFGFLIDSVPRQLYLHFLLRIPSLYFSRVTRIFEDAELSLPDIKRMARAKAEQWNQEEFQNPRWPSTFLQQPAPMPLPRSLLIFRASWESFINSLMQEWQTLNIISVLLMSAILTMLQIDSASNPITRTSALFSLICALMSLLYGCMYIIRFGTMRKMHKASSFANEAQKGTTSIWWNIWVLLAMPAVWLSWSIITFFVCIMSFIWLTGSTQDSVDIVVSPRAVLGLRIGLTVVFALGLIYFVLIVRTFHRYGDPLDREWTRTVNEWAKEVYFPQQPPEGFPYPTRALTPSSKGPGRRSMTPQFTRFGNTSGTVPVQVPLPFMAGDGFTKLHSSVPLTTHPSAFFKPPSPALGPSVEHFKIMQLGYHNVEARKYGYANPMWANVVKAEDWSRFMLVSYMLC